MSINRDIELLFEIGSIRHIERTWTRFLDMNTANLADHIFRVAWIAWTLARYEKSKVDYEKLLKLALIHDLPESRTGDVDYISRQYTKRDEKQAREDMFLGTIHKESLELLEEYEKRESLESKIVKDADNLDVELELVEQEWRGHSIGDVWNKKRKELIHPKLYTKTAKKFWTEIHKSNPHDWHLNTRNRFNSGDWKIS